MPINPIEHPIKLMVENFISCLKSPRAKKTELAMNKSESLSIDTKYPETVQPNFFLARKKNRKISPIRNGVTILIREPRPLSPKINLWRKGQKFARNFLVANPLMIWPSVRKLKIRRVSRI